MIKGNRRRRWSALVWSERAFTMADDDWTLVDEAGVRPACIFRLGVDDDGHGAGGSTGRMALFMTGLRRASPPPKRSPRACKATERRNVLE